MIKEEADKLQGKLANIPIPQVRLITASGEPLQITACVQAPVRISQLNVIHQFLVVDKLVAPVILGLDFLQQHNLVLNFASRPVTINTFTERVNQKLETIPDDLQPIVEAAQQIKSKMYAIAAIQDPAHDLIDDCSIPDFQNTHCEMPECAPGLKLIIQQYKHLFIMKPGKAEDTYHYITTTSGCPVKVPPRRIPAHYKEEVEKQIQHMLDNHIIEQSSNPWMSPAVFVQKKTGEICLCVDYRELINKKTTGDAYPLPLPLPDEVQDWLAGSSIFSTLDLQSGYWQLPVNPADKEKTAFCPGPGMGLFQFCRMPFGLSGAPSSIQRFMDTILRGLSYVTIYLDDILVHSPDEEVHKAHLLEVFNRLSAAGVTLRGKKCRIGMKTVTYLGHVFSA